MARKSASESFCVYISLTALYDFLSIMTKKTYIFAIFFVFMSFVLLHVSIKEPKKNDTKTEIIFSSRVDLLAKLNQTHHSKNNFQLKTAMKTMHIYDMTATDSIVFIGDSNMYRQTLAYAELYRKNCVSLTSRCDFRKIYPEFYRDKIANYSWVKPRIGVEGPVKNGLAHPGCADCGGCTALACGNSEQVRYFPVEFARDVMLQSKNNRNSQEVFAKHIAKHPAQICVLNVGLHDQLIPNITATQYAKNVFDFIKQLHGCQHLIWQQITAVRGDPNLPQTNKKIEKWNAVIESHAGILEKISNIFYVYNISRGYKHKDNVHFHEVYYRSIVKNLPAVT